jgi:hypothetical protein
MAVANASSLALEMGEECAFGDVLSGERHVPLLGDQLRDGVKDAFAVEVVQEALRQLPGGAVAGGGERQASRRSSPVSPSALAQLCVLVA